MEEKKLTDEEIVEILKKRIENINQWETNALEYHKGLFELIHRQKAEIERLTEERDKAKRDNTSLLYNVSRVEKENAEFQKQVNELKNRFENKACCNMSENCSMIQQAVKDTAKEILQELWDETEPLNESHKWVKLRKKNIASRKGVEVE